MLKTRKFEVLNLEICMHLLHCTTQEVDIEQKLKEAPDSGYGIGVFIGTMLPFVILVVIAYLFTDIIKTNIKITNGKLSFFNIGYGLNCHLFCEQK